MSTQSDTQKFEIIEKKNKQIVSDIVQMEGKKIPTETDERIALNTINALLERPVLEKHHKKQSYMDTKDQQLNKIVMVLQNHNMFNEISIKKLALKSHSFKSTYYPHIFSMVYQNYKNYIQYIYGLFNEGLIAYKDFLKRNEKDFFLQKETKVFIDSIKLVTRNQGYANPHTIMYFHKYSKSYIMDPYYQYHSKITPNFTFDKTKLEKGVMEISQTIIEHIHSIIQEINIHFVKKPIVFPPTWTWNSKKNILKVIGSTSTFDNEYIFNIHNAKKPVILDMRYLHPNFCDNLPSITINYTSNTTCSLRAKKNFNISYTGGNQHYGNWGWTSNMKKLSVSGSNKDHISYTFTISSSDNKKKIVLDTSKLKKNKCGLYPSITINYKNNNTCKIYPKKVNTLDFKHSNTSGPYIIPEPVITMHPDYDMGTTMHPDYGMGTMMHPDYGMGTTMHPDYGMGQYHSMGTTMHPDYGMGTTMHPDHIYDRELNKDILNLREKIKVKKEILNKMEDDYEDIERQEKKIQSLEGYHSSCGNPELEMLKQTSHPLTSHKTSSFEKAKSIRTPYDKHWLKIYNGRSLHENYSLDNFKSIP